jgi:hypothetical protein
MSQTKPPAVDFAAVAREDIADTKGDDAGTLKTAFKLEDLTALDMPQSAGATKATERIQAYAGQAFIAGLMSSDSKISSQEFHALATAVTGSPALRYLLASPHRVTETSYKRSTAEKDAGAIVGEYKTVLDPWQVYAGMEVIQGLAKEKAPVSQALVLEAVKTGTSKEKELKEAALKFPSNISGSGAISMGPAFPQEDVDKARADAARLQAEDDERKRAVGSGGQWPTDGEDAWYSPEQSRKDMFGNVDQYYPPFVPDSRMAPISPDEIMNCIRTVQKRLHVDPETLNELFRLSYSRARIVSSLARHVYPEFPTLIEWSMLRKMMIKWHYPVKCLIANAGASTGEPKYQASCFRPGTLMMGADGPNTLYVAVGRSGSEGGETTALRWMRIRDDGYSGTGKRLAERCAQDVYKQFTDDTLVDQQIWQTVGASAVDMREGRKTLDERAWMDFMTQQVETPASTKKAPTVEQGFTSDMSTTNYGKRVPQSFLNLGADA